MIPLIAIAISPSSQREFEAKLDINSNEVNLLIFFDDNHYQQANDVMKNTSWKLKHIADITEIQKNINEYSTITNVFLVHHGRRYCRSGVSVDNKLMWEHSHMVRVIEILINPLKDKGVNLTLKGEEGDYPPSEYVNKLNRTIDEKWGPREDSPISEGQQEQLKIMKQQVLIYTYMSYLLNSISDAGNYISIACNEAEDTESISILRNFVKNKNINIYTNTNKAYIELKAQRENPDNPIIDPNTKKPQINPKTKKKMYHPFKGLDNIGGFFRVPLTPNFANKQGWVKNQISEDGTFNLINTGKDLILNNYLQGKKAFELITPNSYTQDEVDNILFYYSRKYKTKAIELWGENHYNAWKKMIAEKNKI